MSFADLAARSDTVPVTPTRPIAKRSSSTRELFSRHNSNNDPLQRRNSNKDVPRPSDSEQRLPSFQLPSPVKVRQVVLDSKKHNGIPRDNVKIHQGTSITPSTDVSMHTDQPAKTELTHCIPFIEWKDGKFVMNSEAGSILSQITAKAIRVICIAGPYRSGKSYLLNKIIARQGEDAFPVGGTINACTKGIWMYYSADENDSEIATIFLDSEGLGAVDKEIAFDVHVFALCALLSSQLILNTQGCITNSTLEQLDLVVNLSRHVQVTAKGRREDDQDGSDLSAHFPEFLWVLRDFALSLEDKDGNQITPKQYLEQSLKPQGKENTRQASKNEIRSTLASVFKRRDCMTLVRPITDERKLRSLGNEPYHRLRKEFREQLKVLRSKVLEESPAKRVEGRLINGPALVSLAQVYVRGINSGSLPPIKSAWKSVIEIQAMQALERATSIYAALCPAATPDGKYLMSGEDLAAAHIAARERAFDLLGCIALGTPKSLRKKLDERISKLWSERKAANRVMSMQVCSGVAHRVWRESGFGTQCPKTESDWMMWRSSMIEKYKQQSKGTAVQEFGWRFFEGKTEGCVREFYSKINRIRKDNHYLQEKVDSMKKELEGRMESASKSEAKFHEDMEKQKKQWAEERQSLMEEYQRMLLDMQKTNQAGGLKSPSKDVASPTPTKASRYNSIASPDDLKFATKMPLGGTDVEIGHYLQILLQHLKDENNGIELSDHRSFFSVYRKVFPGERLVDWMLRNGWVAERKHGEQLGTQLLQSGCLELAKGKGGFEDTNNKLFRCAKAAPKTTSGSKLKSNLKKGKAQRRRGRAASVGMGGGIPESICFGAKLAETEIKAELKDRQAYTFKENERLLYHHINSRQPIKTTRNLTKNLTKHCMLVTTLCFMKLEAGRVSQRFLLDEIASSVYLGFSKSGLAKVQVELRDSVAHTIHFVSGQAALWFAKVLSDFGNAATGTGRKLRFHSVTNTVNG